MNFLVNYAKNYFIERILRVDHGQHTEIILPESRRTCLWEPKISLMFLSKIWRVIL